MSEKPPKPPEKKKERAKVIDIFSRRSEPEPENETGAGPEAVGRMELDSTAHFEIRKSGFIEATLTTVSAMRKRIDGRKMNLQAIESLLTRKKVETFLRDIFDEPLAIHLNKLEQDSNILKSVESLSVLDIRIDFINYKIGAVRTLLEKRDEVLDRFSQDGGGQGYETLSSSSLKKLKNFSEQLDRFKPSTQQKKENLTRLRKDVQETEDKVSLLKFLPPGLLISSFGEQIDLRESLREKIEDIGREIRRL